MEIRQKGWTPDMVETYFRCTESRVFQLRDKNKGSKISHILKGRLTFSVQAQARRQARHILHCLNKSCEIRLLGRNPKRVLDYSRSLNNYIIINGLE